MKQSGVAKRRIELKREHFQRLKKSRKAAMNDDVDATR